MIDQYQNGGADIEQCHEWYYGTGDAGDPAHATQYDQAHQKGEYATRQPGAVTDLREQVAEAIDDGVGLYHVADTE